jgi:hypothetical protein
MSIGKTIQSLFFAALILLGLLARLAGLALEMVREGQTAGPLGQAPGDAPYSRRGAYPVGTRDLLLEGDVPMELTVWYPAREREGRRSPITYPYGIRMFPSSGAVVLATYQGQAFPDATPDASAGPFPRWCCCPRASGSAESPMPGWPNTWPPTASW